MLAPYRPSASRAAATYRLPPLTPEAGADHRCAAACVDRRIMHPSMAEQVASMHHRELLDGSRRHFRLAADRGHVNFGARLRMALSRGKRGTRGQAVRTLGGEIAGSAWNDTAAGNGSPEKSDIGRLIWIRRR